MIDSYFRDELPAWVYEIPQNGPRLFELWALERLKADDFDGSDLTDFPIHHVA